MSFSELHTLLQQQVDSARDLTALLEREREALEGKDPEQITAVVTEKQALLSQLSQIEMNREKLLHSLGVENTPEAFNRFIQENDTNDKLATLADELRSVLDNCFGKTKAPADNQRSLAKA